MKRTIIVVTLAVVALALLASFALKSRSVPIEVHIAQHTVATETQRVREDFDTLMSALDSAWNGTQAPGDGARDLIERLATSPERLRPPMLMIPGNAAQQARVVNTYEGYSQAAGQASALARELLGDQNAYAEAVTFLRDAGPQIIQRMRDIRLDRVAGDTFQLIIGTVDFATPSSSVQERELRLLLTTLGRDQRIDANMPREVLRLRESVETVLNNKSNILSKLNQLRDTPVIAGAENLELAARDAYQSTVGAADRARLMLAAYAVLLFVAVGFIAFRLQHSYRDLNRANTDLATLNESLEHRVAERTEELAGTLKDLKESQVQLVQAEKMSSLGQLVAGISHEINTPLLYLANNAALIKERIELIEGYLQSCAKAFSINPDSFENRAEYQSRFATSLKELKERLQKDDLEASLEETQDLVKDSIEGLQDLTEMAQSLKDFSRLDRAPVGRFDVNAGMDKTLVIARNIVKHKAEVRKFYGEVPEIECSPSQINQVFLNLVTNAAQAIDKRGEIVITTKVYEGDKVAISVADTGCGIPQENLHKIRDPFFTTKEVGTGTGLGLSIVDEIVRSHGGQLHIESEVGKGSVFTVVLPRKQAKLDSQPSVEADTSEQDTELAEAV